jgi:endonuclease/exonuclease/phosphatase family metal-dependent hydrolase
VNFSVISKDPVVLCGDFNASLDSGICRAVEKQFSSIKFDLSGHGYLKSSPGLHPLGLVDHIFLGPGVKAVKKELPGTGLEKTASDHLPLIAELVIKGVKKDSNNYISAISKITKIKKNSN